MVVLTHKVTQTYLYAYQHFIVFLLSFYAIVPPHKNQEPVQNEQALAFSIHISSTPTTLRSRQVS